MKKERVHDEMEMQMEMEMEMQMHTHMHRKLSNSCVLVLCEFKHAHDEIAKVVVQIRREFRAKVVPVEL